MERPVLYLDLDGVLNPWAAQAPPASWNGAWQRRCSPHTGINVWVNPCLGTALGNLGVEIVWATTWVTNREDLDWYADQSGMACELDAIVYAAGDGLDPENCGKLPGVRAHLGESRRAVLWTDDELGPGDLDYIEQRSQSGAPSKAFPCDPGRGLSEATVQAMARFVKQCATGRRS